MQVENNNLCFACGKENPIGLKLDIRVLDNGELVMAEYVPPVHFQGWANVVHGGILSTLLDEIITYVAMAKLQSPAVTAQLDIRFRKPAPVGSRLIITGKPVGGKGRLIEALAQVHLTDGTLIAEATGKCLKVAGSL